MYNLCKPCHTLIYTPPDPKIKRKKKDLPIPPHHEHDLELVKAKTNEMKDRAKNIQVR